VVQTLYNPRGLAVFAIADSTAITSLSSLSNPEGGVRNYSPMAHLRWSWIAAEMACVWDAGQPCCSLYASFRFATFESTLRRSSKKPALFPYRVDSRFEQAIALTHVLRMRAVTAPCCLSSDCCTVIPPVTGNMATATLLKTIITVNEYVDRDVRVLYGYGMEDRPGLVIAVSRQRRLGPS